jgi:chemosensory pili system protein ChpA (sensor histidine kinase/response regulator)
MSVPLNAMRSIDIAPLSWIIDEVRQSLRRSAAALSDFALDTSNTAHLSQAKNFLHQAHGALQMLDLEGIASITDQSELLLERFQQNPSLCTTEAARTLERVYDGLLDYLEDLLSGAAHQPVKLFPQYKELLTALGAERIHPAELFYPDTSLQYVDDDTPVPADANTLTAVRARFERGLLKLLRNSEPEVGLADMVSAIKILRQVQTEPVARSFWNVMQGMLESLGREGSALDLNLKRLCARINLQMRRAIDGSGSLAERLFKEGLFFMAASDSPSPRARRILQTFGLEGVIPKEYQQIRYARADALAVKRTREPLLAAQNSWDKLVAGRLPEATLFAQTCRDFAKAAAALGDNAITETARTIEIVANRIVSENGLPSSDLALETATALLFLENALDTFNRLDEQFPARAVLVRDRLHQALSGLPIDQSVDWLVELARKTHERQTMATLVSEIQTNLRSIEQTLDAFFRDPVKKEGLASLEALLAETVGALRLLDHKSASDALDFGRSIIATFQNSDVEPNRRDFERVAQTFGALGFYVDALRQPDSAVRPSLEFDEHENAYTAKLFPEKRRPLPFGVRVSPAPEQPVIIEPIAPLTTAPPSPEAINEQLHTLSISFNEESSDELDSTLRFATLGSGESEPLPLIDAQSVERETRNSADNCLRWFQILKNNPLDEDALSAMRQQLNEVRSGAELLDDVKVLHAAREALKLVAHGFSESSLAPLESTLAALISQPPAPKDAPPPSQAVLALVSAEDAVIDAELLSIFLDEAREVFSTMDAALVESRAQPAEQAHIMTLRRAFHTLKGSSRMVGLRQFGDAAWALEQVFNLWLAEEKSADTSLHDLTFDARKQMALWVEQIAAGDPKPVNPEALIAVAERVRDALNFFQGAIRPDSSGTETATENFVLPQLTAATDFLTEDASQTESQKKESEFGSDMIRIGELVISAQLFDIFLAEADNCLHILRDTLHDWSLTPAAPPSEKMVRAVHSLSGSSATAGLFTVHDVAVFLEHELIALQQHPVEISTEEFSKLEACTDRLRAMLHQFAARIFPPIDRDAMAIIDELRVAWQMRKNIPTALNLVSPSTEKSGPGFLDASPVQTVPQGADAETALEDELDLELTELFLAEANELLPQIDGALRSLVHESNNEIALGMLLRLLHTLKGSARMAGALRLGGLLHNMETLAETAQGALSPDLFDELQSRYDRAVGLLDAIANPGVVTASVSADGTEIESLPVANRPQMVDVAKNAINLMAPSSDLAEKRHRSSALVRVRSDVLDRLANQAGEVSIARSRLENDLSTVRHALGDLSDNVSRLRHQLREIEIAAEAQLQSRMEAQKKEQGREFDPLEFDRFTRLQELTRMMAESVNDVALLQKNIVSGLEGANKGLISQARVTRDLQQDLMRVRMVPVDSIADRLYRVVRQAAKETGKHVSLDIKGGDVELDRGVLERMVASFEHLLRNAVVHGIETPENRISSGKSDAGSIVLSVKQQGNEVVFEFVDDGAGLNLNRIRQRALERGLITSFEAVTDAQAAELIFTPGFSTAAEVTELAGRGVGMDVVRSETASLGGQIATETAAGQGTTFSIRLPLTLALSQVVLVQAAGRILALPVVLVEQVQHLRGAQVVDVFNDGMMEVLGDKVSFTYLPRLMGDEQAYPPMQRYSPVISIRSAQRRLVVQVDEVIGNREVVVKNIGPQLARMPGIAGATVLGNGEVVLIIDPTELYDRVPTLRSKMAPIPSNDAPNASAKGAAAAIDSAPIVMVVDDSITVRRVTQRMLLREGFQVVLAKDGVDALEQLQEVSPDIILLDIEMPRMDGFDLTRNLRGDDRFKSIPIVMITSRTADKHRKYALDLGVDVYLGKPYDEGELARIIKRLLGKVPALGLN